MKTKNLILPALLTLILAGCAAAPIHEPKECATTRIEEARPDFEVCSTPLNIRHEPFLERREIQGG